MSVTTVLGHLTPSHTLEYRQNTNALEIKLNKIFEKKKKEESHTNDADFELPDRDFEVTWINKIRK